MATKSETISKSNDAVMEMAKGITGRMRPRAIELAENILVMELKLSEMRKQIKHEPAITEYVNGSQTGTRANPFFDLYTKMLAKYEKTIKAFLDLMEQVDVHDVQKDSISELRNSVGDKFKAYKVS